MSLVSVVPACALVNLDFRSQPRLRAIADWYAARGFVVACADLFWRQKPAVQLTDDSDEEWQRAMELYQGLDEAKAVEDAAAKLFFLRQHAACTGKVGALGFCLGGKLAYLLATRSGPDCSVAYYGVGIESALAEAARISCPTMHMAGRDQSNVARAIRTTHTISQPRADVLVVVKDVVGVVRGLHLHQPVVD